MHALSSVSTLFTYTKCVCQSIILDVLIVPRGHRPIRTINTTFVACALFRLVHTLFHDLSNCHRWSCVVFQIYSESMALGLPAQPRRQAEGAITMYHYELNFT